MEGAQGIELEHALVEGARESGDRWMAQALLPLSPLCGLSILSQCVRRDEARTQVAGRMVFLLIIK